MALYYNLKLNKDVDLCNHVSLIQCVLVILEMLPMIWICPCSTLCCAVTYFYLDQLYHISVVVVAQGKGC